MPRNASADFVQALGQSFLYPVLYVEIYFASGPVRVCTAYQDQILASVSYKAVGSLLAISTIEDGSTVMARGVSVTLSGIDPNLIQYALNEFQVGLPATITLGLLASVYSDSPSKPGPGPLGGFTVPRFTLPTGGAANNLPINAPVVAWAGRTDQPTITVSEKTASITIALESALLDMNTPLPYRYTNLTQQTFYPGDLAFSWVNSIQNLPVYWGAVENNNGTV